MSAATEPPIIYLFIEPDKIFPEDTRGRAIAQDGALLWDYFYTSADIARRAIGGRLGRYHVHYPNGYRLVFAEDDPAGSAAALGLHIAALRKKYDAQP